MPEPMTATRRIAQPAAPHAAAPEAAGVADRKVAQRPRAKEGGRREEKYRPEIAAPCRGWLRDLETVSDRTDRVSTAGRGAGSAPERIRRASACKVVWGVSVMRGFLDDRYAAPRHLDAALHGDPAETRAGNVVRGGWS